MPRPDLQDKMYRQMDDEYRAQNTRDQFLGQKSQQKRRMAGDALAALGDDASEEDRAAAQAAHRAAHKEVRHMGAYGRDNAAYYKDGRLTSFSEGSNPFSVKKLEDFDFSAYGGGAADGKNFLNKQDVLGLEAEGGFTQEDIFKYAQDNDIRIGPAAKAMMENSTADPAPDNGGNNPSPTPDPTPDPTPTPTPDPTPTTPGGINIDIDQSQDNDMTNSQNNNSGTINNNQDMSNTVNMSSAPGYARSWMKQYDFSGKK